MKTFTLSKRVKCRIGAQTVSIGRSIISYEDLTILIAAYLTCYPMRDHDARLRVLDDVRSAVIKEERPSGLKWIVLNFGLAKGCSILKHEKTNATPPLHAGTSIGTGLMAQPPQQRLHNGHGSYGRRPGARQTRAKLA